MSTYEIVSVPTSIDVMCGTGNEKFHTGNDLFKRIVSKFIDEYANAQAKKEKMQITKTILDLLIGSGVRFLKKCPIYQRWYVGGHKVARDKIGHFLRISCRQRCERLQRQTAALSRQPSFSSLAPLPALQLPYRPQEVISSSSCDIKAQEKKPTVLQTSVVATINTASSQSQNPIEDVYASSILREAKTSNDLEDDHIALDFKDKTAQQLETKCSTVCSNAPAVNPKRYPTFSESFSSWWRTGSAVVETLEPNKHDAPAIACVKEEESNQIVKNGRAPAYLGEMNEGSTDSTNDMVTPLQNSGNSSVDVDSSSCRAANWARASWSWSQNSAIYYSDNTKLLSSDEASACSTIEDLFDESELELMRLG